MSRPLLASLIAATCLTGCATAYVPTVPATPLLKRGEVEITAGLRSVVFLETTAAWSPLPHLLLTGELAGTSNETATRTSQGVTTTYRNTQRQGTVGLGYYATPKGPPGTYLAVVGGVGWSQANFFGDDDHLGAAYVPVIPFVVRAGYYDVRYRRYYGQFYCAIPLNESESRGGFSLRAVALDYTRLTFAGRPLTPSNRVFLEPSLFFRSRPGPLRGFATFGLSLPLRSDARNFADARTSNWSGLISGGVILRPDLLLRQLRKRE